MRFQLHSSDVRVWRHPKLNHTQPKSQEFTVSDMPASANKKRDLTTYIIRRWNWKSSFNDLSFMNTIVSCGT